MKASIIITTYNRPEFLKRAISSCKTQKTNYEFEIIVVDDNGIATPAQIETLKIVNGFENVKYIILETNSGACIARNRGAKLAEGQYLFFLDDDDEYLTDKVQMQVDFLDNNPKYDGCLAAFKRVNTNGTQIIANSNFPVVGDFKNFVANGNFFTPMICIRKDSFSLSGGFIDIPRFQDRFYMMTMLEKDFKFEVIMDQLHIMYEHDSERITSKSIEKTQKSIDQMMVWLQARRQDFTKQEWKYIEIDGLRKIGISLYNSESRVNRQKAARLYWDIYIRSFVFSDFILMLKSLIK
ncbi:glycosyltransferase family 2 protein [Epilithonimonas ginsengisoli]|uniref:Glycosyltransferase family 2 protein n=1 Tax=Epilithonimonas ginsengisoli TaxID=1245592 RepID=A0ABU4JIK3_9FLAO|nr:MULTISPECIES: glycosyltransferase family 2 protein [Chryseobacterium group]MBV6879081.1 glycosyltransferase family 2 protein [Epilithonimonas sp. FP105]MDW8549515.1 glycosyltransferase family 2 protein [Epilithonimonas ginsengisoli]OAH74380.1 hypothetical protein AXA65_06360 [Chryseobacterium sp. FP211-J200]